MNNNGVRQCRKCGRLFMSYGASACPSCVEDTDQDFVKVKDYIYDHPTANVTEISEKTGVESVVVLRFLKEGRLDVDGSMELLNCETCGKAIPSGRFCNRCLADLQNAVDSGIRLPKAKPIARMHTGSHQDD